MNDCVFCKIVDGKIPSQKIGVTAKVISILDIHPNSAGHALVIPRHHAQNARDLPKDLWESLMEMAKKVGNAQMEKLGAQGFHLVMNNESAAEQVVFHAHVHVIPRYHGDGLKLAMPTLEMSSQKLLEIAQKLKLE